MKINSEQLAYWYLRLNGFLTIQNFIVHPEQGNAQKTDVDIIGVRFPFRGELQDMVDDEIFSQHSEKPVIAIVEVKKGRCDLNSSWKNSQKKNMQSVLQAIGAFEKEVIEEVAEDVYDQRIYNGEKYTVVLICIGGYVDQNTLEKYPSMPQITWQQVLAFIYSRFKLFKKQKVSHGQWDEVGKELWHCVESSKDVSDFYQKIKLIS